LTSGDVYVLTILAKLTMKIINQIINLETETGINIYNITPQIQEIIKTSGITQGQALIFSRHTTTALAINEDEERLLVELDGARNRTVLIQVSGI
jgi:hypothetical protein